MSVWLPTPTAAAPISIVGGSTDKTSTHPVRDQKRKCRNGLLSFLKANRRSRHTSESISSYKKCSRRAPSCRPGSISRIGISLLTTLVISGFRNEARIRPPELPKPNSKRNAAPSHRATFNLEFDHVASEWISIGLYSGICVTAPLIRLNPISPKHAAGSTLRRVGRLPSRNPSSKVVRPKRVG